jgi:hypothetical protein
MHLHIRSSILSFVFGLLQSGMNAFDWAKKNGHADVAQLIAVRFVAMLISRFRCAHQVFQMPSTLVLIQIHFRSIRPTYSPPASRRANKRRYVSSGEYPSTVQILIHHVPKLLIVTCLSLNNFMIIHIPIATLTIALHSQLIQAATNGNKIELDRLLKAGVGKEGKNGVRGSSSLSDFAMRMRM